MLLAAAWRFHRNHSRGQAHARRLFLVSLAYLPVFFGCLLLHQRRQPATLEAEASEEERHTTSHTLPAIDEPLTRIRERGREYCLHEQGVRMSEAAEAADAGANGSESAPRGEAASADQRGLCPVARAEDLRSSAQTSIAQPSVQAQR